MYEDRNGTDIYYYYDSNGTPTAIRYYETDSNSEPVSYMFYLATNQQGDIIGIYNASGNMVVKYEYDAWGNIISTTDANGGALNGLSQKWSDINPFRYRGYYYDAETELYYLQSRYYDAEVGRFLNADVLFSTGTSLLGFNMFAYCNNNPMSFIDLMGLAPEWWQWLISGAMVVGGVALVATGTGGPIGGTLICSGVNSIIGSYASESNGGSSLAGWTGGLFTGAICGYGAGWSGELLVSATKSVGLSCVSYLLKSAFVSFSFGFSGTFLGQLVSSSIDGTQFEVKKAIYNSLYGGTINMMAGIGSGVGAACSELYLTNATSVLLSNSLNLYVSVMTETVCDVLNLLSSFFG